MYGQVPRRVVVRFLSLCKPEWAIYQGERNSSARRRNHMARMEGHVLLTEGSEYETSPSRIYTR